MTDSSLYRDDSRVRHMLDAMERITELSRGLEREQLRRHDYDTIWDILQNDIPDEYAKVKAVAETLPPEPTQPPPNMADFL